MQVVVYLYITLISACSVDTPIREIDRHELWRHGGYNRYTPCKTHKHVYIYRYIRFKECGSTLPVRTQLRHTALTHWPGQFDIVIISLLLLLLLLWLSCLKIYIIFFLQQECITRAATSSPNNAEVAAGCCVVPLDEHIECLLDRVCTYRVCVCVCLCVYGCLWVCVSVCTPFNRWTGGPITRWPGPVEFECSRLENKPRFYSKRATPPWREKYI